jgi:hypothetical protein
MKGKFIRILLKIRKCWNSGQNPKPQHQKIAAFFLASNTFDA